MKLSTKVLAASLACLMLLFVVGRAEMASKATGLEGKWTASTEPFLGSSGIPAFLAPKAKVTLDGGSATATIKPPVIGWFIWAEAKGSYTKDESGSVSKVSLSLDSLNAKVLLIPIPIKNSTKTENCIYSIENNDTLHVIYDYDKLSEEIRTAFEANPAVIPWMTGDYNGTKINVVTLNRAK
jgi:hypothetical protein